MIEEEKQDKKKKKKQKEKKEIQEKNKEFVFGAKDLSKDKAKEKIKKEVEKKPKSGKKRILEFIFFGILLFCILAWLGVTFYRAYQPKPQIIQGQM